MGDDGGGGDGGGFGPQDQGSERDRRPSGGGGSGPFRVRPAAFWTGRERWRRIAHESSQQARRLGPPEIGEPQPLAVAIDGAIAGAIAAGTSLRYFLDEKP